MSDPRTKSERSKAKDIRQGIVDQRPVSSSKKKKPMWIVRGEWAIWMDREITIGKYPKLADAEKALASASKKKWYKNLRIEEL